MTNNPGGGTSCIEGKQYLDGYVGIDWSLPGSDKTVKVFRRADGVVVRVESAQGFNLIGALEMPGGGTND